MGYCKDCIYLNTQIVKQSLIRGYLYYCEVQKNYVSDYGSCSAYTPKPAYKGGGCFLTSACADHLGKPDDCRELTILRAFRDGYMKSTPEYAALVNEYYEVAPAIVKNIDTAQNKDEYYDYIYSVICDAISHIETGENSAAIRAYSDMVNKLKAELL